MSTHNAKESGFIEDQFRSFNRSYIGRRLDVLELIPSSATTVLDVGCSIGVLGESLKAMNGAYIVGIELNRAMAAEAAEKLDRVIVGDVERINLSSEVGDLLFDCILYGDVLEHLKDPWRVLADHSEYLSTDGSVIASIPNVRHYTTLVSLFRGRWPYRDRGIHDKTHLRFFTLSNIKDMFRTAGYKIVDIRRNFRIIEHPHHLNRYARYLGFWPCRDFLAFQYLIRAQHA